MTALATAYVALLAYVGARSIVISIRQHRWPATVLEVVASVSWPVLVSMFFWPVSTAAIRLAMVPLYLIAGSWTLYTVWRDFRPSSVAARLPHWPPERRWQPQLMSAVFCAILVVPVFILGALVVIRTLDAAV